MYSKTPRGILDTSHQHIINEYYSSGQRTFIRSAYGKHEFMYSNFRFVGIHIWNYILDHLDINVTLPRFKKTFKTHILADNFTYHIL